MQLSYTFWFFLSYRFSLFVCYIVTVKYQYNNCIIIIVCFLSKTIIFSIINSKIKFYYSDPYHEIYLVNY